MKNIFLILFACLFSVSLQMKAQSPTRFQLVQYDIKGLPVSETVYTEVEGYPYLINDWTNGSVRMDDDKRAPAKLKFDIYNEKLLFQNSRGETMAVKNKLLGFTLDNANSTISNLSPLVFVNGLPPIATRTTDSWYQVIADGKVQLLKYYRKIIKEDHPYASATTTKTFIQHTIYYVYKDGRITEITPNKKSLIKLFDDHSAGTDAYLKTNKIDFKSDTDLQRIFNWYNALNL